MVKIGLCFTGGGARGAYQIGALMALSHLELLDKISYYSGVSIGAVNAIMAATNSLDVPKGIWLNLPDDSLKKSENFFKQLKEDGYKFFKSGLYEMDFLEDMLTKTVDISKMKIENVFIAVGDGGSVDEGLHLIRNMYEHYIKKESKIIYKDVKTLTQAEVLEVVRMSCSIPVAFPSVIKNGKKFYDGGIFDNVPVQPLIDVGCDEIVIIHLNKIHFFNEKKHPEIVFHEIKHRGIMGGFLDFSKEHSETLYKKGYCDTIEYFKEKEKEKDEL